MVRDAATDGGGTPPAAAAAERRRRVLTGLDGAADGQREMRAISRSVNEAGEELGDAAIS